MFDKTSVPAVIKEPLWATGTMTHAGIEVAATQIAGPSWDADWSEGGSKGAEILPIWCKYVVSISAIEKYECSEQNETPAWTWWLGIAPLVRCSQLLALQSTVEESKEWAGIISGEESGSLQCLKILTPKKDKGKI